MWGGGYFLRLPPTTAAPRALVSNALIPDAKKVSGPHPGLAQKEAGAEFCSLCTPHSSSHEQGIGGGECH